VDLCLYCDKKASIPIFPTLYKDSPGGFHASGSLFDQQLISLLESRNTVGLAQMDPTVISEAQECAYRSIMIALGVLKNTDFVFKNYCYEAPFGIGYVTGQFIF
jgi:aromatic ring-opening dioxygenase LigB subunit